MVDIPRTFFWLSFCDPEKPDGQQFLGACIVEASDFISAVTRSHQEGCNPGGEVKGMGPVDNYPEQYELNRIYSKDEINEIDEAIEFND
jgi:hypothetical protein